MQEAWAKRETRLCRFLELSSAFQNLSVSMPLPYRGRKAGRWAGGSTLFLLPLMLPSLALCPLPPLQVLMPDTALNWQSPGHPHLPVGKATWSYISILPPGSGSPQESLCVLGPESKVPAAGSSASSGVRTIPIPPLCSSCSPSIPAEGGASHFLTFPRDYSLNCAEKRDCSSCLGTEWGNLCTRGKGPQEATDAKSQVAQRAWCLLTDEKRGR